MTQELSASDALGAVAFAAFAVTMAIARFAADPCAPASATSCSCAVDR